MHRTITPPLPGGPRSPRVFRPQPLALALAVLASTAWTDLARSAEPTKDADSEQALDLPAATVLGEAATPVTQGSHSYTSTQTSAATGLPLSLRDTPQSVTVVTQQRMQDQQLDSVSAALREATGLSAYSQDGEGGRVSFYSRGLEVTNFAYDGMPSAELPNTYVPGDGIQDSAFYDRIEVVRGATGLMSGSGNPSASINLVRKRPTREFSASASVTAGAWSAPTRTPTASWTTTTCGANPSTASSTPTSMTTPAYRWATSTPTPTPPACPGAGSRCTSATVRVPTGHARPTRRPNGTPGRAPPAPPSSTSNTASATTGRCAAKSARRTARPMRASCPASATRTRPPAPACCRWLPPARSIRPSAASA